MAKKPEGTFLTSCGAGTCSPAPVFYRAAVREKNVAALTIFRAPSPNAHTNVAALIERHAGRQVTEGLDDRVMPPNLSLRGGRRPTWQSREGSCDFADGFPVVRPCSARLPRRFAPRNDTSGERAVHQCTCAVELPSARCSGNAAAFPIGAISRFLRKKIPEAQASGNFSLSKKSLWAFSPSCFQNCKIKFCSMILQFCRCGGLWNAKGNPDGFLSHFPSLRDFRLGRFL